jgi:hypothetical protein
VNELMGSYEFLSAEWRRATCDHMTRLIEESPEDVAGVTFSVCEVFVEVPSRLEPAGQVVWHFRMVDGVADYWVDTTVNPDDLLADVRLVMDAAAARPLASLVVADDPDMAAKLTDLSTEALATGAFRMSRAAEMPDFYQRFHDMNATSTTS